MNAENNFYNGYKNGAKDAIELHYNNGLFHIQSGNYEDGIADFNACITLESTNPRTYNNRGFAYMQQGKYSSALSDFTRAIELDSTFIVAYENRYFLHLRRKNAAAAIADLDRLILLNSRKTAVYLLDRGIAYIHLGNTDKGLSDFNTVIDINPEDERAYNNRGFVYMQQGRYQDALGDFSYAVECNSDFVEAYENLAILYRKLGNQELSDWNIEMVRQLRGETYRRDI